jgi:hypothetical protein
MFDPNSCLHRRRRSDRHPHGRRAGKVTDSLRTSPWNSLVSMAHVLYSYFSRGHTHRGPPRLNEMYSIQITVSKYRHTQVEIHRAQSQYVFVGPCVTRGILGLSLLARGL